MAIALPHALTKDRAPQLGLVVLQEDETIEQDFRRLLPASAEVLTTRVPSGAEVTPETLSAMEGQLGHAVALFPRAARFAALAYACTSGAAQIAPSRVADILTGHARAQSVTDPVTALIAACRALGIARVGLVSPYVESVSNRIRDVLGDHGVATPVFGSFNVAEEARVVRIDAASLTAAAETLAARGGIDAVFLSCTNLRTLDLIAPLEDRLGLPVLSSNQVLAWHMLAAARTAPAPGDWGRLFSDAKAGD